MGANVLKYTFLVLAVVNAQDWYNIGLIKAGIKIQLALELKHSEMPLRALANMLFFTFYLFQSILLVVKGFWVSDIPRYTRFLMCSYRKLVRSDTYDRVALILASNLEIVQKTAFFVAFGALWFPLLSKNHIRDLWKRFHFTWTHQNHHVSYTEMS